MRSLLVLDGDEGEQQPVQGQNGLLGTLQLPAGVQQAQHKAPDCIKVPSAGAAVTLNCKLRNMCCLES
jgi:hypothetical protein